MITSLELTPASTNSQSDSGVSNSANTTMGKDDFLKLLVAQMQAQDPLDPMDSADFSAQLAQFSALEQMTNVNTNLESLILQQANVNNNMAINLIGKTITSPGNGLSISEGTSDPISYELGGNANSVVLDIYDSANNKVASIQRGTETIGTHSFDWDGKDSNGNVLQDGNYTFEITAIDNNGLPVASKEYQKSEVTGVVFENGVAYAIAGNQKIDLIDIIEISSTQK